MTFALYSAAIVSCEKKETTPITEISPLEFEVKICTDNAIALSVSPDLPDEYYIGVYDATFYNDNLDKISSELRSGKGNVKKLSGEGTAIFLNLEQTTEYYVCAVYSDEKYLAVSESVSTQGHMNDIKALPVDLIENGEYYMDGLHNFTFRMTDAEYKNTDGGFGGFWEKGTLLEINAAKEWKGVEHLPEASEFTGIYSSDPSLADKPGSILLNNSSMRLVEDFSVVQTYNVSNAVTAIEVNDDKITAVSHVTLSDGTEYSFTYEGNYTFHMAGYYGRYGYKPLLDKDLVGLDYPLMKDTYYCGEVEGLSHYSMACVNDPDPNEPFGGFNKHCIRINILAPHQENPMEGVPTGTYTISADSTEFSAIEGDYKRIDQITCEYVGTFYYNLDKESYDQTMGFLTSGKVIISKDGSTYKVEVEAETHDGHKVSGTYEGPLTVVEEPEW